MSFPVKAASIQDEQVFLTLEDSFRPNSLWNTFGFHIPQTTPHQSRMCSFLKIHQDGDSNDRAQIESASARLINLQQNEAYLNNIFKVLGYVPLAGLIPCMAQLIVPLIIEKNCGEHSELTVIKIAEYMRGAASGLGIGCIYILPDLAVTAWRFLKA